MRSLGMSRRQLSGLLALEHIVVVVMGLSLGSWSGLEMSRRMVASVAVTDQGDAVLPPFSLITDWALMGPIYAALLIVFGVALYPLDRSMRGVDIQTIARSRVDRGAAREISMLTVFSRLAAAWPLWASAASPTGVSSPRS